MMIGRMLEGFGYRSPLELVALQIYTKVMKPVQMDKYVRISFRMQVALIWMHQLID